VYGKEKRMERARIPYLYLIIALWALLSILLGACAVEQTGVSPSEIATPPRSTLPSPSSSPTSAPAIPSEIRLRIEYDLTADWGELEITGLESARDIQIVEKTGTEGERADPDFFRIFRQGSELVASMTVDLALPPDSLGELTFLSTHAPDGGAVISVYLLPDDGEPLLLNQFDHRRIEAVAQIPENWHIQTFSMDLASMVSMAQAGTHVPPTPIRDILNPSPEMDCGMVITVDTTLTKDLSCGSDFLYVIKIGAPNITLDLGGRVISGRLEGIWVQNTEGITIKNGTIDGFNIGIVVGHARDVTMEDLTIRNMDVEDADHFISGIVMSYSEGIVVRDTVFEFVREFHKEAVILDNSEAEIVNIKMHGGSLAVNLGGSCDQELTRNRATILNNDFTSVYYTGILAQCVQSARIAGNVFAEAEVGIATDPSSYGDVSGLEIEGNTFHENVNGIQFIGVIDSRITNNIVETSKGESGISIKRSMGCYPGSPGFECFFSTGNLIADNEVSGYFVDLYHDEDSLGNTWQENTCNTRFGAEIPETPGCVQLDPWE
jgi:nitrous oxidase accessory protein NosD